MASSSSQQGYGIIILGNSGVGKSFLANILLGREAFAHRIAARAVTTTTEFEELRMGNDNYAIFNVPGLIEADQQRIEMNKRQIDKAFVERPTSLILYVFGQQNGRIRDEDIVAFNALNKAYPLKLESLILIVNGLAKDRPKDYEGEVIVLIKELIQTSCKSFCVLDMIDKSNPDESKNLKNRLLQVIVERTPSHHIKKRDIELQREEVRKAKEEIKNLQVRFKQDKKNFAQQIEQQQKQYNVLFDQVRQEKEQMQLLIQRQAEEQRQRDVAHKNELEEANRRAAYDLAQAKNEMRQEQFRAMQMAMVPTQMVPTQMVPVPAQQASQPSRRCPWGHELRLCSDGMRGGYGYGGLYPTSSFTCNGCGTRYGAGYSWHCSCSAYGYDICDMCDRSMHGTRFAY